MVVHSPRPPVQRSALLASAGLGNAVILWRLDRVLDMNQILHSSHTWIRDYWQIQSGMSDRR